MKELSEEMEINKETLEVESEAEGIVKEQKETLNEVMENTEVKMPDRGEIIKGVVVQVNQDEVLVDVGAKSEGVIFRRELTGYNNTDLKQVVKVGDKIDVMVIKREDDEGRMVLSKDRADIEQNWDKFEQSMENGDIVEGKVLEVVNGGLIVDIGVRAFLPASLLDVVYVEDLSKYLNQVLKLKIIEMNKPKRKVIVSRKAVIEKERAKQKEELFNKLEAGQVVKGTVQRLTKFGAFVDIGGVDGLLHISEMAWYRVVHPSDIVKEGEEIEVKVLKVDKDNEKISLGLKQVLPDPWDSVENKYKPGDIIAVKVVRIAPFGAFVELEPGVEGLIHISHLAKHHVEKPEDVVKEGEEVNVKVLTIDKDEKRIRLSMREAEKEKPVKKEPHEKKSDNKTEASAADDTLSSLGDAMPPELAEKMAEMAKD